MASGNPDRPNILLIVSDAQGAWALGCAGNDEIHTPVLDRLARNGVRFANFFCTSPVCSPARASLLTGDIPSRHGVHDWIRVGSVGRDRVDYLAGQTLDQALADMKSGATEKALTETAQVFVAGGAYDKVPDLRSAVAAGLPILEAAKKLRK